APYTDDAPPVIVSTRAMAALGMPLISTVIDASIGIARRPVSRTRFRFVPRPRRLTVAALGVVAGSPSFDNWPDGTVWNCVTAGMNCGIWFSTDSIAIVLDS